MIYYNQWPSLEIAICHARTLVKNTVISKDIGINTKVGKLSLGFNFKQYEDTEGNVSVQWRLTRQLQHEVLLDYWCACRPGLLARCPLERRE